MKTNLHLVFAGNCREAFAFYETTFGSKVQFTMTYGEAPEGSPVPPEMKDAIMHMAMPLGLSLIHIYLRVLERAGLIARGREAQWRPCKLKAEPLRQAAGWLDEYRRFWEESFDRLEEYLQRVQAEQKQTKGRTKQKKEKRDGRSNSKR